MEHPELHLLLDLGYIAIAAAVFAFGEVDGSIAVAYILAGMLLGPGLGIVLMDHSLELISELGIALLLFLVGLELSLEKVKNLIGRRYPRTCKCYSPHWVVMHWRQYSVSAALKHFHRGISHLQQPWWSSSCSTKRVR